MAESDLKKALVDTSFLLATFSTEPGGLLLKIVLNLDTLSAVSTWLSEISLKVG